MVCIRFLVVAVWVVRTKMVSKERIAVAKSGITRGETVVAESTEWKLLELVVIHIGEQIIKIEREMVMMGLEWNVTT